jgi:hypothetical protein
LDQARKQLAGRAERVRWIVADVREAEDLGQFDIWHDRAVFHFLTEGADRRMYASVARQTVPVGGHVIIATFAPDGPEKCSGLTTCRYGADALAGELGDGFQLVRTLRETHLTPFGKSQAFTYAMFRRE